MTTSRPYAISTAKAPPPAGAYSQAVRFGDLLVTAGQGPFDPHTGEIVGLDIKEQTAASLRNIECVLAAGGADMGDVVKVTVHLADLNDFPAFDEAYREFFPGDRLPARTTVQSGLPGIKIEVDVTAVVQVSH